MMMMMKFAGVALLLVAYLAACDAQCGDFDQEVLDRHNEYRAARGAAPMKLNADLKTIAQDWADYLASSGYFMHQTYASLDDLAAQYSLGSIGENLAYTSCNKDGGAYVDMWYDEVNDYDSSYYTTEPPSDIYETCGHFTQVVWNGSTELGCAKATTSSYTLVVCNYAEAGNWQGEFTQNVFPISS